MQESNKITTNLGETLLEMMRQAVREEIRTLIRDDGDLISMAGKVDETNDRAAYLSKGRGFFLITKA